MGKHLLDYDQNEAPKLRKMEVQTFDHSTLNHVEYSHLMSACFYLFIYLLDTVYPNFFFYLILTLK